MLTKEILFGMNILTLAGFVVMGLTLTLNRMGQAGKAVRIGLVGPQVRLWSSAGCMREAAYGDSSSHAHPTENADMGEMPALRAGSLGWGIVSGPP